MHVTLNAKTLVCVAAHIRTTPTPAMAHAEGAYGDITLQYGQQPSAQADCTPYDSLRVSEGLGHRNAYMHRSGSVALNLNRRPNRRPFYACCRNQNETVALFCKVNAKCWCLQAEPSPLLGTSKPLKAL